MKGKTWIYVGGKVMEIGMAGKALKGEIKKRLWGEMKCLWCGKLFDGVIASCGTGFTWSLFKCPHCKKLMADGNIIPTVVKDDPEIRIRRKNEREKNLHKT